MEKKRSFLGFLASLFIVFFTANAFAAGYTCDKLKKYTSCNANYYLNGTDVGNACVACATGYTKAADSNVGAQYCTQSCTVNCKQQTCPANATCTHGTKTATGTRNQTQAAGVCSATQPTCSITISCNASYYKTSSNTCQACGTGQYSAKGATSCSSCTNKPANSYYTGNASSNACPWACNSGYHKNAAGTACYPNTKYVTCSGGYYIAKGATACSTECPANKWCAGGTFTISSAGAAADTGITGSCPSNYTSPKKSSSYTACSTSCTVNCSGNATCTYANATCTYDTTKTYTGTKTCQNVACSTQSSCSASGTCPVNGFNCNSCYVKNSGGTACIGATYTITYANGGGTGSSQTQSVKYKGSFTTKAASTFSRPGYTFSSWGGNYPNANSSYTYNTCGNTTLTASWNACTANTGAAGTCGCGSTQYPNGSGCSNCSVSCSGVTGFTLGTYNVCNAQTNNICYRNCTTADVANSKTVSGTVTKGGTSTCKATACKDGYYYKDGVCNVCPANAECDPNPGSNPITCDDGYTLNDAGTGCTANKYNVTYSCAPGTGTVAGNTATYNLSYSPKSSSCTAPSKHKFVGWTISGTSTVVTPGASFTWKYLENKTFTAKYEATSCDSGQYLSGGACVSCPSGYTASDLNATSNTQCYKACSQNCVSPSCPANSTECTFDTTAKWTGKQYYNSSTCQINDGQKSDCPIATLNCKRTYYTNGSVCSSCSSLGDGSYTQSLSTNNSSPYGCYAMCTIPCTQQACPAHATCTHGTEKSAGGIYYPSEDCTAPGISCTINITCDSGYALDAGSATCNPVVTPVVLNRNYNSTDSATLATIYQKYETGWYSNSAATTTLSKATVPTRANYNFLGYYTARTGGSQVIKADGTLPMNTTYETATSVTLYAQWSLNNTDCQAGKYYNGSSHVTCPAGKYCPGTGSTPIGTAGCAVNCPADAAGGTVTSDAGSSVATACRTVRTNQNLSDNSGRGDQTCYYNTQTANYSTGCTIKITACNAGYYREQENSTTCSSTDIGEYSPANDLEKYLCKNLSGAATDVTTAAKNSGAATLCYNPCGNVTITNGTRVPVNEKEFYDGAKIPACTYTTNCNTGYQASGTTCVAKVLTITLNHNNGTANSTIYLKYADGWYSNSNASASSKITTVTVPSKGDGMAFEGYVSTNNDVVVGSDGKLTTNYTVFSANAIITAQYGNRTAIHCDAGKYYEGGSKTTCTTCPAGSYCPGVDTFVGVDSPRGINTCASLGGTYTHADGAAATTVSSAAGATGPAGCYATNVSYTSSTNKATGSQTCYFNESTTSYTDSCKDKVVLSCVGGYWRANAADTDCVAVGIGYYSADKATTRTACPNLSTTTGVKTFTETSETVTQCYLGNIWYQGQHSGHRRSCYHTADATDTNVSSGYSYNCDVSVIVTCDAGYYDDGNYTFTNSKGERERDCVAVTDKNSYSPAQSFFTSEEAQPNQETPGSSTKLHNCPETKSIANGTARRVFNATWTASDYAVCEYKAATCDAGYRAITSGAIAKCVWDDPDACPEGFYCPDGGEEPIECPKDKAGRDGTTEVGAKSIEQCFIAYDPYSAFKNGTGSAICNYSGDSKDYTRCHDITAKSCNAGYYYRDAGSATCVEVVSGNYSPAGNIQQISCPSGGNGSNQFAANWDACYKNCEITVAHSSTVAAKDNTVFGISANGYAACSFHVTCQTGYSPNNNDTAAPTCDANRYTVTLDKNGGDGNVAASIECTFDSGACALPATTGLTRAGYSVGAKWCTEKDGTGTCYNGGTTVTTNISANGTATTLYAIWTPNVYQITLKHADATVAGAPATAYLKYATGWFADNSATLPLSQMSKTPEKTGYEFAGYKAANNTVIVDTNGMFQTTQAALTFTTAAADVTVVWSAGNTKCAAGTYYQGTGATCLPCTDNHYCPGGSFATDGGQAGLNECRDNGKTAADAHASSETQCFKEDLPTYVAAHGKGTQKCYFDTENLTYSTECTDKFITSCDAGYWQENKSPLQTAPDCAAVGNGYYSAENTTERTACPNGGTTAETTAATVQRCYKSGMDYAAEFGTGTQRCYYSSGDGAAAIYNRDCDTKTINKCRGGYWLNTEITAEDCSPVGYDHYSETDDTARHACEGGGKTNSEITSSPLSCYKDSEEYTATHGGGFRTCYYTSGTGASALYETSCETPTLTYCNGGYYADVTINTDDCIEVGYGFWSPAPTPSHLAESLDRTSCAEGETTATATSDSADACYTCPAGQICDPDNPNKPQTCSDATKGTHPNSDAGNTDVNGCWRECALAANAATMKGHDYYGKPDTCAIDRCKSGYTYNTATQACEICPEGTFCGGGDGGDDDCPAGQNCDTPKSCADLGDGSWKYSDAGATGPKSCYRKCESYALDGGTAVPVNERAYYSNQCEYKGVDEEGNPCDIEDGTCVTTSCKPSYEMIGGKCVACNRDHALSYKTTGNCMVESCEAGWHPYGQSCETDITECSAPNALRAEKQWDYKKNSYGICLIKECEDGFHISSNACVADVQECVVEHGIGEKEWNHTTNTWGECVATSCDPGFTNDPYETNEPTKQCGHCKNKFGVKGELAASSYSRGCTISACMYQGEMYNLENNECNPICDVNGYEDETGTMKWNPATHKCERKCKEGYVMW